MVDTLRNNKKMCDDFHTRLIGSINSRKGFFFTDYNGIAFDQNLMQEFAELKNASEALLSRMSILFANQVDLNAFSKLVVQKSNQLYGRGSYVNEANNYSTLMNLIGASFNNREKMFESIIRYNDLVGKTARLKSDPFFYYLNLQTVSLMDSSFMSLPANNTNQPALTLQRPQYLIADSPSNLSLINKTSDTLFATLAGYNRRENKFFNLKEENIFSGSTFYYRSPKLKVATIFLSSLKLKAVGYKINLNSRYDIILNQVQQKIFLKKIE